jgi:exonuclease III
MMARVCILAQDEVRAVTHHTEIMGSDHCPVSIDLEV